MLSAPIGHRFLLLVLKRKMIYNAKQLLVMGYKMGMGSLSLTIALFLGKNPGKAPHKQTKSLRTIAPVGQKVYLDFNSIPSLLCTFIYIIYSQLLTGP